MTDPARFEGDAREPLLNAPAVAVATAASMPILYLFQSRLSDDGLRWALYPAAVWERGDWIGLFTSMLLHAGWAHVASNAIGALIFGAPVARLLRGRGGLIAFFTLYIGGGFLAALGYALIHPEGLNPVVGASGAVFALIGAAMRLLGAHGFVRPLTDRRALGTAFAWLAINAVVGLIGFAPGVEGGQIAWEAHAVGLIVGYLAIGPLGRAFGPRRFASGPDLSDPET